MNSKDTNKSENAEPGQKKVDWWSWNAPDSIVRDPIHTRADAVKWLTINMWLYLALGVLDFIIGIRLLAVILIVSAICLKLFYSRAIAIGLFVLTIVGVVISLFLAPVYATVLGLLQLAITFKAVEAAKKIRDLNLTLRHVAPKLPPYPIKQATQAALK